MALLARANQLMVDELYEEAIEAYDLCLADDGERCAAAYSGRCAAYLKLEKGTAALQDAKAALELDPDCEPALYRKGIACFGLDEYESALEAFRRGHSLVKESVANGRKYALWIRKCQAEIEDDEDEEEEEEVQVQAPVIETASPIAISRPTDASEPKTIPNTIKYQYYQTSSYLTISVLAKNVPKERATVEIAEKTLLVRVTNVEGYEMTVICGELYDPVIPAESSVRYLPTKIEIKLKKKESFNWNDLLVGETIGGDKPKKPAAAKPARATTTNPPSQTPYSSKRNWNTIEKEMAAELEKEKPEGEEALNKLFQDIYGKATPETRRAMNKSFQTSGGTVLSTNWDEVQKANYEEERQAPSGMIWKTWEGNKLPQKDSD